MSSPHGHRSHLSLRMAAREARSSATKFLFVVLAVAVGVGALTGVRGFSQAFHGMLLRDARTLMAADLMVRNFDFPTDEQIAYMEELEASGIRRTWITETVTMVSSERVPTPLLVSIKAVDPSAYPFYGEVKLEPEGALAERLTADTVAVSDDLMLRLEVNTGDTVRLGSEEFRVTGVVKLEPDRMTGTLNVGPRIMMTRQGLDRADLIQVGSQASQRYLFKIPPDGPQVGEVHEQLRNIFGRALVTDYRESHPRISRGLDRATTFLSLLSLIALMIGALGVAMAMHAHLQQRMDTIAIMKCLGARSSQIIRIYMTQTLLLGLAGGLGGIALGGVVQAIFPSLIERYFSLRPELSFDFVSAIQALLVGVLVTLLFTLPPLLGIRNVRPAAVFRREMAEARKSWRQRWDQARASALVGGVILLGIGLMAIWLTKDDLEDSLFISGFFLGGLIVGLASLTAVSWLLLRTLRSFLQRVPWKLPATLRHGAANLYRPGNHAQAVLVALGIGVMFTMSIYLVQYGLLAEMVRSWPQEMPNVFLINVTDRERTGLVELLSRQPGVEETPHIYASLEARIVSVDGIPIEQLKLENWNRRLRRPRSVTWLAEQPSQTEVIEGAWWEPTGNAKESGIQICVGDRMAEALQVKPGSRIEWLASGRNLSSQVACVHRIDEVRFGANLEFVFNPGALEGLPATYFGGLRVRPADVGALQRAAYEQFPTVTVINAAEVLAIVQEVVDQVALVIRFVSFFAILAGVVILASSVAGTRFRRIREAAILKTLGATRKRVIAIFSVEFLILGAVAGLMGGLLASGFSSLLLRWWLDASFQYEVAPNLIAIGLTAMIAMLTVGWPVSGSWDRSRWKCCGTSKKAENEKGDSNKLPLFSDFKKSNQIGDIVETSSQSPVNRIYQSGGRSRM